MRFLEFCFVLTVLGISAKAQEKDTCFYHVSFYKWEWNYSFGRDTLRQFSLKDHKTLKESIDFGLDSHPHLREFHLSEEKLSYPPKFIITSCDEKLNFEIQKCYVYVYDTSIGISRYQFDKVLVQEPIDYILGTSSSIAYEIDWVLAMAKPGVRITIEPYISEYPFSLEITQLSAFSIEFME